MIPNLPRIKSRKHLEFVRGLPSAISGRTPCEAHHLIGHSQGGMGLKASDLLAFPLTADEHAELHRIGWKAWEEKHGSQWMHVTAVLHLKSQEAA